MTAVTAAFPNARWYQYDPAGPHTARDAARMAFGRSVNTYYRLDRADVILSLDSDFLRQAPEARGTLTISLHAGGYVDQHVD